LNWDELGVKSDEFFAKEKHKIFLLFFYQITHKQRDKLPQLLYGITFKKRIIYERIEIKFII